MCCQMLRHWVHHRRWSRCVRRFTPRWMNTASSSILMSPAVLPSSCCDSRLCAASASSVPITSLHQSSLVTWVLSLFYWMPWRTRVRLFSCVGMVNRLWKSSQNIGRTTVLVDLRLLSVRCWQHGFVVILVFCSAVVSSPIFQDSVLNILSHEHWPSDLSNMTFSSHCLLHH